MYNWSVLLWTVLHCYCVTYGIMHRISLAILSRLSCFLSLAVCTDWPFCDDTPSSTNQSISQSILYSLMTEVNEFMFCNCFAYIRFFLKLPSNDLSPTRPNAYWQHVHSIQATCYNGWIVIYIYLCMSYTCGSDCILNYSCLADFVNFGLLCELVLSHTVTSSCTCYTVWSDVESNHLIGTMWSLGSVLITGQIVCARLVQNWLVSLNSCGSFLGGSVIEIFFFLNCWVTDSGTVFLSSRAFHSPFEYLNHEEVKRMVQGYLAYLNDGTNLISNPGIWVSLVLIAVFFKLYFKIF